MNPYEADHIDIFKRSFDLFQQEDIFTTDIYIDNLICKKILQNIDLQKYITGFIKMYVFISKFHMQLVRY